MASDNPPPEFHRCTDARVWAYYFAAVKARNPDIADDVETMTTWFANAIMAGFDAYSINNAQEEHDVRTDGIIWSDAHNRKI